MIFVPVPGVNPVGPKSTFHDVSVPPAVHEISTPVAVTLLATNPVGSGQDGGDEHETEYTNTDPAKPFSSR